MNRLLLAVSLMSVGLAVACSGSPQSWEPNEGLTIVKSSERFTEDSDLPDSVWSGQLIEVHGCVGVRSGNEVSLAVFSADSVPVKSMNGGGQGVQINGGSVLQIGTEYWGGGVAIEDLASDVSDDPNLERCAAALTADSGVTIWSGEQVATP